MDDSLFVSDRELRKRLGVGEHTLREALQKFEREADFPKKDAILKKRYWPAVKAFLDRRSGLKVTPAVAVAAKRPENGVENFDD